MPISTGRKRVSGGGERGGKGTGERERTLSVVGYVGPVVEGELDAAFGKVVDIGGVDDGEVDAAITGSVSGEVERLYCVVVSCEVLVGGMVGEMEGPGEIEMLGRALYYQLKKHKRG